MSTEAMRAALEALQRRAEHDQHCEIFNLDDEGRHCGCSCGLDAATEGLRNALAAAPAASAAEAAQPTQERKPLTDELIDMVTAVETDDLLDHIYEYGTSAEGVSARLRKIARAIERAHGITGEPK